MKSSERRIDWPSRSIRRLSAPRSGASSGGVSRRSGRRSEGPRRVHVVTTDAMVEGVHFDRTYVPLRALGWKAIATNVSDVAAMNARPRFATVALGLPNNLSVEGAEALYNVYEIDGLVPADLDALEDARAVYENFGDQ